MPWAKFGDGFHNDDRVLALDHPTFRLYVCGHTFAMGLLLDNKHRPGLMTEHQVQALARHQGVPRASIGKLVGAGLWERTDDGGYHIYKFDKFLPSRRELIAEKGGSDPVKAAAGAVGGSTAAANRQQTGSSAVAPWQQSGSPVPVPGPGPEPVSLTTPSPNGDAPRLPAGTVAHVWKHYQDGTSRLKNRKPLAAEAKLVLDRVRDYGLDVVVAACYGWRYDDWDRRPQNIQPEDIWRRGNIEKFAEWEREVSARPGPTNAVDKQVLSMIGAGQEYGGPALEQG